MDATDVARSVFPAPFRSLARSIGGAEFAAVVALALHLMGVPVVAGLKLFAPSAWLSAGWIPSEWGSVATVVAIAFVVALVGLLYVLGLAVDYWATEMWSWVGRTGDSDYGDEDDGANGDGADDEDATEQAKNLTGGPFLKPWHEVRSQHHLIGQAVTFLESGQVPDKLEDLPPWLHAQRWWWESDNAASQLSDLQLRLSVAKMTGFNAALAALVALIGLAAVESGPVAFVTSWLALVGTGGLWLVMTNPGTANGDEEDDNDEEGDAGRPDWTSGVVVAVAAGLVYVVWIASCPVINLESPGEPEALSLIAVVGTYLAFVFAYVRMQTNALYHRIVRDATGVDVIGEGGPDAAG